MSYFDSVLKSITQQQKQSLNKAAEDDHVNVEYIDGVPHVDGKPIKDKGIALCHRDQGYSANHRHESLLTKRKIIRKATGQRKPINIIKVSNPGSAPLYILDGKILNDLVIEALTKYDIEHTITDGVE
ncbi:hypothetical protein SMQE21_15700 [Serratia marcescens]|nr:hypothetical protein SMQE21_15700 [Serratia marcescens]